MRYIKDKLEFEKIIISFLTLVLIISGICFSNLGVNSVYAKTLDSPPVEYLFFYATNKEGKNVLLKTYSKEEFLKMQDSKEYYYSSIDAYPMATFIQAKGIKLTEFIEDVKNNSKVEGARDIEFTTNGEIGFLPTDFEKYKVYTYEDLYGVERYYFPDMYRNYDLNARQVINIEEVKKTAVPAEIILSPLSYQRRMIYEPLKTHLEQNDMNPEGSLDGLLIDDTSLRLYLPQTMKNMENSERTAHENLKWVHGLLLTMEEGNRPQISAGEVAEPVCNIKDNGDETITVSFECETEGADIYYSFDSPDGYGVDKYPMHYNPQTKYDGKPITLDKPKGTDEIKVKMHANKVGYSDKGIVKTQYPKSAPYLRADGEGYGNEPPVVGEDIIITYTVDRDSIIWRDNISDIQISEDNGKEWTSISNQNYTVDQDGLINIDSSIFKNGISRYKVKFKASGYADKEVIQTVLNIPPVVKSDTKENYINKDIEFEVIYDSFNKGWIDRSSIYVNDSWISGIYIDKTQSGKIIIKSDSGLFSKEGNYQIKITNSDYKTVTFLQTINKEAERIELDRENSKILPKKTSQPKDKIWTIKFNKSINKDDYFNSNVLVIDKDNFTKSVKIELGEDSKTLKVFPPADGYKTGETYTIIVKGLKSMQGETIDKTTIMDFIID